MGLECQHSSADVSRSQQPIQHWTPVERLHASCRAFSVRTDSHTSLHCRTRALVRWCCAHALPQVPLITLTEVLRKRLKADTLGNMVFWLSFCVLGQPMCLVLYYHDWLLANLGEQGWLAAAAQGDDAAGVLMA